MPLTDLDRRGAAEHGVAWQTLSQRLRRDSPALLKYKNFNIMLRDIAPQPEVAWMQVTQPFT